MNLNKNYFDFHADDFGVSKNSCNDIITLLNKGCLNSISILPNMTAFDYAVEQFKKFKAEHPESDLKVTVHLNFMEGHCCAEASEVPDLVDEKGYFKISWGNLFKCNYMPWKHCSIKKQLKAEIKAQTLKCINAGVVNTKALRFDGHQHTHMIPLVFNSLLEVIDELKAEGYETEFIRNTEDPVAPYNKAKDIKSTFDKLNIIKCLILNYFSAYTKRQLKKRNLPVPYLCGVFFSGHMDYERLEKVLPFYMKKPEKQNRTVEILFHPGSVLPEEIGEEFVKPGFNEFHLSEGRKVEYQSLEKFKAL